jgi:hypothetical protein
VDIQGNILVGNDGRDNIEVYSPVTGELLTIFGEGVVDMPTAITVDAVGNIYVTDAVYHHVKVFDSTYNFSRTIGKPGVGEGTLRFPTDTEIMVGSGGQTEIFVADQGNYCIQVFDGDGNWLRSLTFDGIAGQNCSWMTGICEVPGTPPFTRVKALSVIVLDPTNSDYLTHYGGFGTTSGLLRVPMDVLVMPTDTAIVTPGDGERIEIFTAQ